MTLHYHGLPITPRATLLELAGRCFCVSYATQSGTDCEVAHEIGQSVMLDNGAFSFWRVGKPVDWQGYHAWAERWLEFQTTWAVIPDVIDGDEADNDRLLVEWRGTGLPRGAPVWHMHESIDRLRRLCHDYPRVCVGSSGEFAVVGDARWRRRMDEAFNAIYGYDTWVHMLRGMSLSGDVYPFASVDSTDVARNHNRPHNTARKLAERWDGLQCPSRWVPVGEQGELA